VGIIGKAFHNDIEKSVVTNQTALLVIHRTKGLIVIIVLLATVIITNLEAVSRIVQENGITRFTVHDNLFVGCNDIVSGRFSVFSIIIQEESDVIILESLDVLDANDLK
jgi:hypothetical protein